MNQQLKYYAGCSQLNNTSDQDLLSHPQSVHTHLQAILLFNA